jgi:predicted kinase
MLAPDLAPAPGAVLIRTDVERKALFGVAESLRLPAPAYAPEVTAQVYALVGDKARRVLAAGHGAIVDAVFARRQERAAISVVAKSCNVAFRGLFLTADLATRLARVGTRTHDASDADADVARAQESYDLGLLDWHEVDASGAPDTTLAHARAALDD